MMRPVARYWGRKPIEVVRRFIQDTDSVIVDPFGGSGAIISEALGMGKRGIYVDLNPYAWLIAHVQIAGAPTKEFAKASGEVIERAMRLESDVKGMDLPGDWLFYGDGKPFLKRRNFDRVSQFFPRENLRRLRALLMAIDYTNTSSNTKLALYLSFANALYPSSFMNRRGAGSWGVPSYWVPQVSSPMDAYEAFRRATRRMLVFLRRIRTYSVCYSLDCDAEARLILGDANGINYDPEWTLITDPPFTDEVQYMELSFFYWVWLRISELPNIMRELLGRDVEYSFERELVINPRRGVQTVQYLDRLGEFLSRTANLRRRILIFHEESEKRLNRVRELVRRFWGSYREYVILIDTQRNIGPRGGIKYFVFEALS